MPSQLVSGIRRRFQRLSQSQGQIAHVLLTRSPLIQRASSLSPFDLHVLSTPPAFILSQDQTLHLNLFHRPGPKSEPVEEESEPAFTKTGNSAFFKKQEKDVWHALLSFQGTGSRFRPRTRRPTGATIRQPPSEDGNFRIRISRGQVNENLRRRDEERVEPAWKELEPLSGWTRNIGVPGGSVKQFRNPA